MIAEIPAPECAVGTGLEKTSRRARHAVLAVTPGILVEVTGVGFFDFMHEQKGAAPNGIELHPVLGIDWITGFEDGPAENPLAAWLCSTASQLPNHGDDYDSCQQKPADTIPPRQSR